MISSLAVLLLRSFFSSAKRSTRPIYIAAAILNEHLQKTSNEKALSESWHLSAQLAADWLAKLDDQLAGIQNNSKQLTAKLNAADLAIGRDLNRSAQSSAVHQLFASFCLAHNTSIMKRMNADTSSPESLCRLMWLYIFIYLDSLLRELIVDHLCDRQTFSLEAQSNIGLIRDDKFQSDTIWSDILTILWGLVR